MAGTSCCYDAQYDAATHRMYVLHTFPLDPKTHAPATPALEQVDLSTGRTISSLPLPGVMAGTGQIDPASGTDMTFEQWVPGFALSPDGSHVAILDGNSNMLQLIDTGTMHVIRRVSLSEPESPLQHTADLLGLSPTAAEAKQIQGVSLQMQFSPDGNSLYVTGWQGSVTNGTYSFHQLGLRRIDVTTGTVTATAFQDGQVWWTGIPPDGSAVYALIPSQPVAGQFSCPCTLDRLDPDSLAIRATRVFQGDPAGSAPSLYILR
jgi:DNA-binding beta-propeller fold protein YncE